LDAEYILTTNTGKNDCGDEVSHSYSILGAISIKNTNGTKTDLLLLRNPWGYSYYNGSWNNTDSRWTDDIVSQLPIDP
jgi:hypothetical protein